LSELSRLSAAHNPKYFIGMVDYHAATSSVTVTLPANPRDPITYPRVDVLVTYASVADRKQLPFYGRGKAWWPAAVMKALEVKRGVNCNQGVHINRVSCEKWKTVLTLSGLGAHLWSIC
jgi:hypothetical protein